MPACTDLGEGGSEKTEEDVRLNMIKTVVFFFFFSPVRLSKAFLRQ